MISVLLLAWVYFDFLFISHWGECLDYWFKTFLMSVAHLLSRVWLFVAPWTVACQAFLPMEFSKQEYWSGLPFPTLEDLPDPGIEPVSLVAPALAGGFFTTGLPGKPKLNHVLCLVTQLCLTLCDPMDCSPQGSSVHRNSPGKNTGGACHSLLQGILPTQGSDPALLHCRWIL